MHLFMKYTNIPDFKNEDNIFIGISLTFEIICLHLDGFTVSLTVTCSCCPYLYFGSVIMLMTYFVNFR